MTEEDLAFLKQWFSEYTHSFYTDSDEDQRNIMLKIEHTRNVCQNMAELVKDLSLNNGEVRLAEAVALFHDIGRFPQYAQFRTFRDADSVNHGLLGAKTLTEKRVLHALPKSEQELITTAVKFHGAYALPSGQNEDTIYFLKLIRDADKIDIYRVFNEYYESPEHERASATAFGVPDTPEYSEVMLSCICRKRLASYAHIKTENDFKLMKLSWIYDINFDASLRLLQSRNYVNGIIDKLPRTDDIARAMGILHQYISERLGNER
jgi:HD superfamily phosphohydrolase YqeK